MRRAARTLALVPPDGSPFVTWDWLASLEEAGCVGPATEWGPAHLTLHRDGRLVAAAPAYVKTGSEGEFVFDWDWAEASATVGVPYYPKLVVAVPFTPVTGARALVAPGEDRAEVTRALASGARQWAHGAGLTGVHVLFPGGAESALWASAGYAERLGVQYHWRRGADATWDDFLARFPSKRRTAIRREAAQLAKDDVTVETLSPDALTTDMVHEMYDLYARHVEKFVCGRRYLNLRFFELLAERMPERMAWVVARKGGRVIAGAFNVQQGSALYGRYWGTHVELPFLHFNVCYYHGVRHCLARGLDVFEPGAGGEHKRVRGFDPTLTHSNHWVEHPGLRRGVTAFLSREREAIEAWVARPESADLRLPDT